MTDRRDNGAEGKRHSMLRYSTSTVHKQLVATFYLTMRTVPRLFHPAVILVDTTFHYVGVPDFSIDLDQECLRALIRYSSWFRRWVGS